MVSAEAPTEAPKCSQKPGSDHFRGNFISSELGQGRAHDPRCVGMTRGGENSSCARARSFITLIWTTVRTTCVFVNTPWSDFRESTRVALDDPSSLLGAARRVGVGAIACAHVVVGYLLDWLVTLVSVVCHGIYESTKNSRYLPSSPRSAARSASRMAFDFASAIIASLVGQLMTRVTRGHAGRGSGVSVHLGDTRSTGIESEHSEVQKASTSKASTSGGDEDSNVDTAEDFDNTICFDTRNTFDIAEGFDTMMHFDTRDGVDTGSELDTGLDKATRPRNPRHRCSPEPSSVSGWNPAMAG